MAEKRKLTVAFLDTVAPSASGARIIWDTDLPGLAVRVTRGKDGSTNRVMFLQFRVGRGADAKEVKFTFGSVREHAHSAEALTKLRERATEMRLRAKAEGVDPREEKKAEAEAKAREVTFSQFAETYIASKAAGYADGGAAARLVIGRALAAFGKKLLADVYDEDIEALHGQVVKEFGPAAGRKTLGLLSPLFTLAEKRRLIPRNPTRHVKPMPARSRDVVLTESEMARFWAALDVYALGGAAELEFSDALRLIALTGSRKSEVLAMAWGDVDLEAGLWTREAAKNKNRKLFMAPLSPDAVAILKAIRARRDAGPSWARTSPFVFASNRSEKLGRLSEVHEPFKKVLVLAEIDRGVHVHDLRATFVTTALVNGMQPSLLRHLTGHASTAVLDRVYNRLQSVDTLREGLAGVAAVWGARKGG